MPYSPQTWSDAPSTATPLSAARLQHIEDGISYHETDVDAHTGTYVAYVTGLDTTGATSSTTTLQAAITACAAAGGGTLHLPAGTIRANVTIPSNVILQGEGTRATVLKSVASANADVIKGTNFASLTNTLQATPEAVGDNYVGVKDMTIDGDTATNSSGYGIRLWGRAFTFENLVVRNCANDGIWTEFAQEVASFSGDNSLLEGSFSNITTVHNDGNGWTFLGPHDSCLDRYVTYGNGGWGFESRVSANYDGAIHGDLWNSFLNTTGSYKFATSFNLGFAIASGASGTGVEMVAGVSNCSIRQLNVGGHAVGLILRGAGHNIRGVFETCSTTAVRLDTTANCILDFTEDNCAKVFDIVSDQGYHAIRARIALTGAEVLKSGTFASTSTIDIKDSGAIGNLFQLPGRDILAGGYTTTLPQNDGVLLTVNLTTDVQNKSMGVSNTYRGLTVEGDVRSTVPAAATDAATTQALVNAIRTALIALGTIA